MDYSALVARLLGIYILIMNVGILIRRNNRIKILQAIAFNESALAVCSLMGIIVGIVLVVTHNYWAWNWRLIVTLLSWWILIKCTLLFWFPEKIIPLCKKINKPNYYITSSFISIIIGLVLLYFGFWYSD